MLIDDKPYKPLKIGALEASPNESTYLCLCEVPDPGLCHDGDAGGLHDLADHAGVGRPRDPAVLLDVGGDPLQRHHRHRPRTLGHPGLEGGRAGSISVKDRTMTY